MFQRGSFQSGKNWLSGLLMTPGAMLHKLSLDPLPTCQLDFRSYVGAFVLDSMWFRFFRIEVLLKK